MKKICTSLIIWIVDFIDLLTSKLSNILMLMTIGQLVWMSLANRGIIKLNIEFDLLHEDTILIMHLMTWFIVRAIENTRETR